MENDKVVYEINKYICSQLWIDFEVVSFDNENLIIHGGVDLLYGVDIEIIFNNVFAVQGKFCWTISTDSDKDVKYLIFDNYDDRTMLENLQPEIDYHLFAFNIDNDYDDKDLFFYIFAKSVQFSIKK